MGKVWNRSKAISEKHLDEEFPRDSTKFYRPLDGIFPLEHPYHYGDDRQHEQDMDNAASNMESKKTKYPADDQNDSDRVK
jgi:hypothetical protein